MLKFFRRIRQKLINEGNLKKYLTYAIGEIVLVVIGILIALQVNNWSLDIKEKSEEKKALRELREGFRLDLNDLSLNKKLTLKAANSCKIIIEQMENRHEQGTLLINRQIKIAQERERKVYIFKSNNPTPFF